MIIRPYNDIFPILLLIAQKNKTPIKKTGVLFNSLQNNY